VNLGLEDKVALVCGASRGLGRAVAEELVGEGAAVALCARKEAPLAAAVTALEDAGGRAFGLAADLAVPGEPTRVVEECISRFGRLDILVTNSGGPPPGSLASFGRSEWQRATALLLESVVEATTVALPGMRDRGWGRILCVTSIVAKRPVDNLLLSNALRPAVAGFAQSLAREVAREGIIVNTILPGFTRTERVEELEEAAARDESIDPAAVRARIEGEIPMGRLGEPAEFAALAVFLVSERASYITGAAFAVDGGWLRSMF
jgi:3-oxoacyl-[acyl-carrier protein] reductase